MALPTSIRPNNQLHEPLTPQSSRNSSFSAASDSFNQPHMIPHMHQPPTPRSPYYEEAEQHRSISPSSIHRGGEYTPVSSSTAFDSSLRISCPPPMAHQLLAAAQSIQNSPGGLSSCSSSCSSATNTSCTTDYFFRTPQQHQYQLTHPMSPHPISPGTVPSYPSHLQQSGAQNCRNQAGAVHYTQAPQTAQVIQHIPVTSHEQQQWFVQEYPQQIIPLQGPSSYFPQHDLPFVKQESDQTLLPTPRGSFC